MRLAAAWSGWRCSQCWSSTTRGRSRRSASTTTSFCSGERREAAVRQAERLAVRDAQDARRLRGLGRARLGRAAAAALAARQVHQRDAPAARRLARERPAHDELGVVGMRADRRRCRRHPCSAPQHLSRRTLSYWLTTRSAPNSDSARRRRPPGPSRASAPRPSGSRSCARPCPRCRRPAAGTRVSACLTTSGSPPASEPTTGTPQAIASSAERPNDSSSEGSRNTSATPASSSMRSCAPEEAHAVGRARAGAPAPAPRPAPGPRRPSAAPRAPRGSRARGCAPRRARASRAGSSRRAAGSSGRAARRRLRSP